jgi:hypothetical protein
MLISPYTNDWLKHLDAMSLNAADFGTNIYLLLDGVFVPKLHRKMAELSPALLFESLPGCNDETRDVSPFLIPYEKNSPHFARYLAQCSGWPMVSVIETSENKSELAERLAAWCVIEADGQRFNFRFPDTRRLPTIFSVLTQEQKSQMAGPAKRWSFVGRDGTWQDLPVVPTVCSVVDRPALDERQFAKLVGDSESDEMLTMLVDRGYDIVSEPYLYYEIVSRALGAAQNRLLDAWAKLDWCEYCVREGKLTTTEQIAANFATWHTEST